MTHAAMRFSSIPQSFAFFAGFARDDSEAGFRAKDAKAAKVLQADFFKFIYKSLDVAFQEFSAKIYQ